MIQRLYHLAVDMYVSIGYMPWTNAGRFLHVNLDENMKYGSYDNFDIYFHNISDWSIIIMSVTSRPIFNKIHEKVRCEKPVGLHPVLSLFQQRTWNMSDIKHRLRREKSQKEFAKSFIRNDHLEDRSFISRINWLNCTIVFGVPLLSLYGVCTIKTFVWQTWLWAILYYRTGLGITAGIIYTHYP